MSSSFGYRATVTLLFIVIGLPPALCSLYSTPEILAELHGYSRESRFYAVLAGVLCLFGFAIFAVFLTMLIRAWRGEPR
ncbi:MAG TPA: hypothetical protein VLX44_03630 [Xanthobacteraceae bacterium]|nr:hypothetical protein [Xanthobacteraceae bacterium]